MLFKGFGMRMDWCGFVMLVVMVLLVGCKVIFKGLFISVLLFDRFSVEVLLIDVKCYCVVFLVLMSGLNGSVG